MDEGHEVLVIDNYATGRRDNLSERDGLEIVEDTIEDPAVVLETFERFRPDFVVHAAAAYKDPDAWGADVLTNALGTVNVVRAAQATGVERLLYFQTALCYGTTPTEQPVTLDHPIRPDSSYGISKTAGELYIEMSGLDFVSFRLANAYGPRNISGPLPTFYHRLTEGKGVFVMDTRRDFIFIDDLVDVVDAGGRRRQRPRPLPRLLRVGLLDQGAVRRHDRRAAGGRAGRRRRGAARGRGRRVHDPARPEPRSGRTSAGSRRCRSRRACAARSTTTASTAISQTYTHLKVGE